MLIILQARLGSSRLPQKALLPIGDSASIVHTLRILKKIPSDAYFLATDEKSYEQLYPFAHNEGFEIFAGSEENVLERFCVLIKKYIKDKQKPIENLYILRATGDNPFLFYEAAIELIAKKEQLLSKDKVCDYLTFTGLPHGSGIEILKATSLLEAWENGASNPQRAYEEEHVSPSLYHHPEKYVCHFIEAPKAYFAPNLRTTIDTKEDYQRNLKLYRHLREKNKEKNNLEQMVFSAKDIIECLEKDSFKYPILYIPKLEKGFGTGHFRRALLIASELDATILVSQNASFEVQALLEKALRRVAIFEDQILKAEITDIKHYSPSLIVLDKFSSKKTEIEMLSKIAPLVLVDEGSPEKNHKTASYLLDIIPSLKEKKRNFQEIELLDFRGCKKKDLSDTTKNEKKRVLLSLGGEDPGNLTDKAKTILEKALSQLGILYEIDLLSSKNPVSNLKERLFHYDLVITHYGLTAFEALASNCQVLLLSTSKIHKKLAKKYGFHYISRGKMNEKIFEKKLYSIFLDSKGSLQKEKIHPIFSSLFEMNFASLEKEKSSYAEFLLRLSKSKSYECPVCKQKTTQSLSKKPFSKNNFQVQNQKIIERVQSKTIRQCSDCFLYYPSWMDNANTKYSEAYFFDEYKNQYGKTYLEDFSKIKMRGKERIKEIQDLKPVWDSVLDIGCAYGPFLDAAREGGFDVFGTDISKEAVLYVQNRLKIPAINASFPDFEQINSHEDQQNLENMSLNQNIKLFPKQFGIITMWFVIEHFQNLDIVLKKVNALLPLGGIFAFSTPNANGITMQMDKKAFFEQSPLDHFSLWHKKAAKKILKKYGFKIKKIKIEESHIERLKKSKRYFWIYYFYKKSGMWKKIALFFAKKWLLSDTFEIYCIKTHNIL